MDEWKYLEQWVTDTLGRGEGYISLRQKSRVVSHCRGGGVEVLGGFIASVFKKYV